MRILTSTWYPVIDERSLARIATRFMRRRDVGELPRQTAGTVLVFEVGARYEVFRERRHLTGKEEAVVEAVSVSLVDMRARAVEVTFHVPSRSPADVFRIAVTFNCQVTEPDIVVGDGLLDIRGPLQRHLQQDRETAALGALYEVDDINEAREELSARVRAYSTLHPPRWRGMQIRLLNVAVDTPTALVQHATRMRDVKWQRIVDRLAEDYELEKAEALADLILQGPERVEALAIARGEQTAAVAAQRAYDRESETQRSITDLLAILQKDGHLDRIHVDADTLVQTLSDSFRLRNRSAPGRLEGRDQRGPARGIEAGDPREPVQDLVLDEDDLDDE